MRNIKPEQFSPKMIKVEPVSHRNIKPKAMASAALRPKPIQPAPYKPKNIIPVVTPRLQPKTIISAPIMTQQSNYSLNKPKPIQPAPMKHSSLLNQVQQISVQSNPIQLSSIKPNALQPATSIPSNIFQTVPYLQSNRPTHIQPKQVQSINNLGFHQSVSIWPPNSAETLTTDKYKRKKIVRKVAPVISKVNLQSRKPVQLHIRPKPILPSENYSAVKMNENIPIQPAKAKQDILQPFNDFASHNPSTSTKQIIMMSDSNMEGLSYFSQSKSYPSRPTAVPMFSYKLNASNTQDFSDSKIHPVDLQRMENNVDKKREIFESPHESHLQTMEIPHESLVDDNIDYVGISCEIEKGTERCLKVNVNSHVNLCIKDSSRTGETVGRLENSSNVDSQEVMSTINSSARTDKLSRKRLHTIKNRLLRKYSGLERKSNPLYYKLKLSELGQSNSLLKKKVLHLNKRISNLESERCELDKKLGRMYSDDQVQMMISNENIRCAKQIYDKAFTLKSISIEAYDFVKNNLMLFLPPVDDINGSFEDVRYAKNTPKSIVTKTNGVFHEDTKISLINCITNVNKSYSHSSDVVPIHKVANQNAIHKLDSVVCNEDEQLMCKPLKLEPVEEDTFVKQEFIMPSLDVDFEDVPAFGEDEQKCKVLKTGII